MAPPCATVCANLPPTRPAHAPPTRIAGPELLLGDRCTNKADIYSMGVVLWELATQVRGWSGALAPPS